MTDLRKAAEMAFDALENIHPGNMTPMAEESWNKAAEALRQALAQHVDAVNLSEECVDETDKCEHETPKCSDHPDAPHGFNRDASHSLGRYVCDCEGWAPEDDKEKNA